MTIISTARSRRNERILRAVSVIAVIAMIATLAGLGVLWMNIRNTNGSGSATASGAGSTTTFPGGLTKTTAPPPRYDARRPGTPRRRRDEHGGTRRPARHGPAFRRHGPLQP